ncbi:MAG: hypothetical protein HYY24_27540 [Verrucomicrobia bacterium]|nr:hypothetical protein [Verrucomicrobiota bacterium]
MKRITLWTAWAFLVVVYVATVGSHCVAGKWLHLLFAVLNLACCAVLAVAEALEISFSMIFPIQESSDPDIRESFRGLDPQTLLAERQVIVAVTIVTLTATTMFEWIYIPCLGRVSSHGAPAWFALAFVTSTVLWFCQIGPKLLAAKSPCRFWRLTRWLVKPILTAGKVTDLRAPAADLVRLWERVFASQEQNPEHRSASMQVAQLWAACDCAVCNPRADFTGISSGRSLSACTCALCDPAAAQAA